MLAGDKHSSLLRDEMKSFKNVAQKLLIFIRQNIFSKISVFWCHDIQPNDTSHNGWMPTLSRLIVVTRSGVRISVVAPINENKQGP